MNVVLRVTAGPHTGLEYIFDCHATFVVGRSSQAQFSVPDDGFLSRNHFLVEFNPPACYLRDMGSTNGTTVNGVRVTEARLSDGDVISVSAVISDGSLSSPPATATATVTPGRH